MYTNSILRCFMVQCCGKSSLVVVRERHSYWGRVYVLLIVIGFSLMIERLERTKVVLHQESLPSIAADGIVLSALLPTSCSYMHARAAARPHARTGSGGSASYKIDTTN